MSNINSKMAMVSALAMALMPEHHIYQLHGDNIGIGKEKPEPKPKELTEADFQAIEKAKLKRERRRATRLKHRAA